MADSTSEPTFVAPSGFELVKLSSSSTFSIPSGYTLLASTTTASSSRSSSSPNLPGDVQAAQSSLEAALAAASSMEVALAAATQAAASKVVSNSECHDGTWNLDISNYKKYNTDANIGKWWFGGTDNETGITWPAKVAGSSPFTMTMAADFMPDTNSLICTLEAHTCAPADACTDYTVLVPAGVPQTGVAKSYQGTGPLVHYGWFAVHSVANLWAFSQTFMSALTNAGVQIASANMQLTTTFSQPANSQIKTRAILAGFAFLIAIFLSFVPVLGEVLDAGLTAAIVAGISITANAACGSAGSFIGLSLTNGATLDSKAATFGAYMSEVFNTTASAIDQLVSQLMQGKAINSAPSSDTTPTILTMLEGGNWVNTSIITSPSLSLTNVTDLLRDDLASRGINYVWGQYKIWVTYANLGDDASYIKCAADKNGWQASKYCGDGGVYYLYRFNEDGPYQGHLAYPYGADKMGEQPFGLDVAWVTKGSANSYRAQNNGVGGFNYDSTQTPGNVTGVIEQVGLTHSLDGLRTVPGVWNISVCDMGDHSDWNVDYSVKAQTTTNQDNLAFIFPCCCGPQCSQTQAWVAAANMNNFKTLHANCQRQMALCKAWPPDVTTIDYGKAGQIHKKNCLAGDSAPNWDDESVGWP